MEFVEGQTGHHWFGRFVYDSPGIEGRDPATYGTCVHAIRRKDWREIEKIRGWKPYEIGVVAALDGNGYELVYDNWGSQGRCLEETAGKNLGKVAQAYNASVAMQQLFREGYRVTKTTAENGDQQLIATR